MSNPGSTRPSATAVRISSADPISSTSASATSTTTRTERTLFCRNPVPDRPALSFSVVVRSVFELWSAGIRPKISPVASETADGEGDDHPVETDDRAVLADARQAGGVDRQQRADAGPSDEQPEHSAGERQHDALGQELADDAPARAADGGADRDLAAASGRADEQQVRDVCARDQQHEADRATVDQQRLPRLVADDDVADRADAERVLRPDGVRKLLRGSRPPTRSNARPPAAASRQASAGRSPGSSAPGRSCSDRTGRASTPAASVRTRESRNRRARRRSCTARRRAKCSCRSDSDRC